MANQGSGKQSGVPKKANTLETLKDFGSSIGGNTVNSFKDMGAGMFDQLLGISKTPEQPQEQSAAEKKPVPGMKREFNVFSYQNYHETTIVQNQIKELVEQIRKEVQYLQKADKALLNEVKDIEKISIDSLPEKPGIYHVRFLEIVLRVLRTLREKVGESRTWLQALTSKKKKRGSLFASNSKKKGTQYSLSQELNTARSVQ